MKIRKDIKDLLEAGNIHIDEYYFKNMKAPPLTTYITPQAIAYLNSIATSIKLSGKINYKYSEIERVMESFGFMQIGRGTNRVTYRHLEDNRYVVKVAVDDVGIRDNPREFINQDYLYPFVTKIFEVDPTGTVALVERVEPIRHRLEFESVASKIFDLIRYWFTGRYVMEDIGSEFFMNWGIRQLDGCPVLLDFPYMYELDYYKIKCQKPTPTGPCNGIIDYDDGYNRLFCPKCGARYRAIELAKAVQQNKIKIDKGEKETMIQSLVVTVVRNGVVKEVNTGTETSSVIEQRYAQSEQSSRKASKAIRSQLNDHIMNERSGELSDSAKMVQNAIALTRQDRLNINETVGEVIERKAIDIAQEEVSTNMLDNTTGDDGAVEVSINEVARNFEEPPVEDVEEDSEVEETTTEETEEDVPEDQSDADTEEEIDTDLATDDTLWDVQGNFIPRADETSEADEVDEADEVEADEEETDQQFKEIKLFDIYGILIDIYADNLNLPDNVFAYELKGSEEDPYTPATVENGIARDNYAGTVILTAEIEFAEGEDSIDIDGGLEMLGTTISMADFLDKVLAESEDYETNMNVESVWDGDYQEDGRDPDDDDDNEEDGFVDIPVGAAPPNSEMEVDE